MHAAATTASPCEQVRQAVSGEQHTVTVAEAHLLPVQRPRSGSSECQADRGQEADRDGIPEAQSVPGDVGLRQRDQRAQAGGYQGRQQGRSRGGQPGRSAHGRTVLGAFFLATDQTPGHVVEAGPTERLFNSPVDPRASDYVNGRFGSLRVWCPAPQRL